MSAAVPKKEKNPEHEEPKSGAKEVKKTSSITSSTANSQKVKGELAWGDSGYASRLTRIMPMAIIRTVHPQ